jgi:hypothetical protein
MEASNATNEENLQKLMVIMKPSESCVVYDGLMTSFDAECLKSIAGSESIISDVFNMRTLSLHYTEQQKQFVALRLNLIRLLMEHYLTFHSPDDFMGSQYRDFMIK